MDLQILNKINTMDTKNNLKQNFWAFAKTAFVFTAMTLTTAGLTWIVTENMASYDEDIVKEITSEIFESNCIKTAQQADEWNYLSSKSFVKISPGVAIVVMRRKNTDWDTDLTKYCAVSSNGKVYLSTSNLTYAKSFAGE